MQIDAQLIVEARFKASGANTHAVEQAVAWYRSMVNEYNESVSKGTPQASLKRNAQEWEKRLRKFVATGVRP